MTWLLLLLLLIAFGHGLHLLAALNSCHGLGVNLKWIDDAVMAILVVLGMATFGAGWWVWDQAWSAWPLPLQAYSATCLATLFVTLPAITIRRHLRQAPVGARTLCENVIALRDFDTIESLAGSGSTAWMLRLPGNEALELVQKNAEIVLPSLPKTLDGLSLLHLTDLHFSKAFSRLYFERVIEAALDGPTPDLVLITGDFMDDDDALAWITPVLSRLESRLGKFAVLGNHDYRHNFLSLHRELRTAGFVVLEGDWSAVEVQGATIAIGGTSYPWGRDLDPNSMPPADLKLLMSHSPDQIYRAARWGLDLVLAGHVHGGQIRLPIFGPFLMPSIYGRRFDRGFFRVRSTVLYVGQGIAGKHPIRYNCKPEVTRLILRAEVSSIPLHHTACVQEVSTHADIA